MCKTGKNPVCSYCGNESEKVGGRHIYPHREDLYHLTFYVCDPCKAWVGCHRGTDNPLGRLANAELRQAKSAAHSVFDQIWKRGLMPRYKAYSWLADQLGIDREDCHIGMFDVDTCERVVLISRSKLDAESY